MFDKKIIDEIKKSKGYSIALCTTFNFEINFFERAFLGAFFNNQIRKIEIFVDQNEFDKSIQYNDENQTNIKYLVMPIDIKAAFHPKVVLLLGEEKAKLIVSSANLTTSGYMRNNEIYNVWIYDNEHQENLNLIKETINFFKSLNHIAYYQDNAIFSEIEEYEYINRQNNINEIVLINNMEMNVIDQVKEIITKKVKSIDIAVPFYDRELEALKMIKESFDCEDINVYIQNERSTFPVEYNNENNIIRQENIFPFILLKSNGKKNFYHGKVFRFNTSDGSYIMYGSSNCTMSALFKTYKNAGNIECNILEHGEQNEFDYFFNNFDIDLNQELIPLSESDEECTKEQNYRFKYGINDTALQLYISYKVKYDDLKIFLGELELKYEYTDKWLMIGISQNVLDNIGNIFDLSLKYDNQEEIVRCWYIDIDTIESYRSTERNSSYDNISLDEDIDKYREDMMKLAKVLILTKDEYTELTEIKNGTYGYQSEILNDIDEEEISDEFIDYKEIPDEYIEKSRDFYKAYEKSKIFSNRFFGGLSMGRTYNSKSEQSGVNENIDIKRERNATIPEKRFERFIKNRIKFMLCKDYAEIVSYEHYKNGIGLVLDIINKYKYDEKVCDIFDDSYVCEISTNLIINLLDKRRDIEDKEEIILLSLTVILENYRRSRSDKDNLYKIENKNKQIINKLEEMYEIRTCYDSYLMKAVEYTSDTANITYNVAVDYIEKVFGYKTQEMIRKTLEKTYGVITMDFSYKYVNIVVNADSIKNQMVLNENIIKDIDSYYKHQNNILDRICITINNKNDNYEPGINYIKTIVFEVDLKLKIVTKRFIRKNGSEDTPCREKIIFL